MRKVHHVTNAKADNGDSSFNFNFDFNVNLQYPPPHTEQLFLFSQVIHEYYE